MDPNKSHIKRHLSSMGLIHIFSLQHRGWWSFSEAMGWCRPSQGDVYCLVRPVGSITLRAQQGLCSLVCKLSFHWLASQERRKAVLCSGISRFYPGNQMQGSAWRSMPSCVGSGLTHQSYWLQSCSSPAEVGREGQDFNRFVKPLSPKPVAGQAFEMDHGCRRVVWCMTMDLRHCLWGLPTKKRSRGVLFWLFAGFLMMVKTHSICFLMYACLQFLWVTAELLKDGHFD